MTKLSTKRIVLSGLFLAIGLVLPFLTGQIPSIGSKLLPMHIPVLLAGFVCGWQYGLCVGFITPVLRSVLFTMPPMMPTAVAMAFELAAYGCLTGLLYELMPKRKLFIYAALIISMIAGRIVWGIVSIPLYGAAGKAFTWQLFLGGAFLNAVPGIIIQIIIIPIIIMSLKGAGLIENGR